MRRARFFRAHGFNDDNVHLLEQGLFLIAQNNKVTQEKMSMHGTKYVVSGRLKTPRGTVVMVETVWIVESEEDKPRLVTGSGETVAVVTLARGDVRLMKEGEILHVREMAA